MQVPDGTVWTGRYPVSPGSPPRDVVVRVRAQGWTSVDFDIEHAYGDPVGIGQGSLPTAPISRSGVIATMIDINIRKPKNIRRIKRTHHLTQMITNESLFVAICVHRWCLYFTPPP